MNSSIQGVAITLARYREDKILKRLVTTPLKPWKFVLAQVSSRLVINLIQIAVILLLGVYAFGAHIFGNLGLLILIALFGGLLLQSIGFAVASVAKTTDAAHGLSVTIALPMMFLAYIVQ